MPINYGEAINDLASEISNIAEAKGFWEVEYKDDQVPNFGVIPLKLALIHSEVSEALEVHREEYDDGELDEISVMSPMQEQEFVEELADIVIRALDIAGAYDFDIGTTLIEKIENNRTRPARHGKRY